MDDIFNTSYLRSNIVSWLPLKKGEDVLYIRNGVSPIEHKLHEKPINLTVIPPEMCKEIKDKFDYVICIGNFVETTEILCKDSTNGRLSQASFGITFFMEMLKENGKLILALENKLGLKYWCGAKEEKSRNYFAGLEQDPDISGISRKELCEILQKTGLQGRFYYPFPDYRFAISVYSDDYLPKTGELRDQVGNFDEERLTMFDEGMAMDTLIEEGLFPTFSNSYLLVIGRDDVSLENKKQENILYIKFSNDRHEQYNILTGITEDREGRRHIHKLPDSGRSMIHITHIERACLELVNAYKESRFLVNRYRVREGGMELEYLTGRTLEEEADRLLEAGEEECVLKLILDVAEELKKFKPSGRFDMSQDFIRVFGKVNLPSGLMAPSYSSIDCILPNIILGEDESWTLIDYEWSFEFSIPINFTIYRMIHYYVETSPQRQVLRKYDIYQRAGISQEEMEVYPLMEEAFQNYILSGHVPLRKDYDFCGKPVYHVRRVLNEIQETERKQALTFYFDNGNGFSEQSTKSYRCEALDGVYDLMIRIPYSTRRLRIDPGNEAVTVEIKKLHWYGNPKGVIKFLSNGHKLKENLYLFDTRDPNILLESIPEDEEVLVLELKIETMSLEAAEWLAEKIDRKYRLKKRLRK